MSNQSSGTPGLPSMNALGTYRQQLKHPALRSHRLSRMNTKEWKKISCSGRSLSLSQFYRLGFKQYLLYIKMNCRGSPKPLSNHSQGKKKKQRCIIWPSAFFIYELVLPNQTTNRWIEWSNDKLSWQFVPGGATRELNFIYSLQMTPNAGMQELDLCHLPSIWSGITAGKLTVGGTEAFSNQFVEL